MAGNDHAYEYTAEILREILDYCDGIGRIHGDHQRSRVEFGANADYCKHIIMCLLQIGEQINHLPQDFTAAHPEIPWRRIRKPLNIFVYRQRSVDLDFFWSVATDDVDKLRAFCREYLEAQKTGD